jgi:hypothetical protein
MFREHLHKLLFGSGQRFAVQAWKRRYLSIGGGFSVPAFQGEHNAFPMVQPAAFYGYRLAERDRVSVEM